MNTLILLITSFISFIVLDLVWLGVIAKPAITGLLAPWMTDGFKLFPAILVYVLLALGTVLFVLAKANSFGAAILWGAILGLIVYGVYDLTNYATIAHWPLKFLFMDMAWGTVCGGSVAGITFWISKLLK